VGQTRLRIDALPIPGQHPVRDKCMAQVVNARPHVSFCGLEPGAPEDADKQHVHSRSGILSRELCMPEQAGCRIRGRTCMLTCDQVLSECRDDAGSEGQAAGLEKLGVANVDCAVPEIDVAYI